MAVDDLWRLKDGNPSKRAGRGRRWRVRVDGYPATLHRTKAEADQVELDRLRAGPPRPASAVTVGDLLDRWLATKAGLSPAGLKACQLAARRVRGHWGDTLAVDVLRPDVAEWIAGLQATASDGSTRPAATTTKVKSLQALSGAMEIGIDLGAVDANPCVKVRAGRVEHADVSVLTVDELRALATAAGKDSAALVWTLGTIGPRIWTDGKVSIASIRSDRKSAASLSTRGGNWSVRNQRRGGVCQMCGNEAWDCDC